MIDLHHLENAHLVYGCVQVGAGVCCADCRSHEDVPLLPAFPMSDFLLSWFSLCLMAGRSAAAAAIDAQSIPRIPRTLTLSYLFRLSPAAISSSALVLFHRFRFVHFLSQRLTAGFVTTRPTDYSHLPPSQPPLSAQNRAATQIKIRPATTTNSPAMVAMPTTARSDRIMVIGFVFSM